MWRMNMAPNIDECLPLNTKMFNPTTPSPLERLPDLANVI
jgi:hypothetical protein